MKKIIYLILLAMFSLSSLFCRSKKEVSSEFPKSIYEIILVDINGKKTNLSAYKGKKMLIVNVASKCGFTEQYDDLQKLYEKYGDKLVILGFPSNEFGFQEPGTNTEIQSFCKLNYGVTFPMFAKINTKGSKIAPIYQWLTDKRLNGVNDKTPSWNFAKYLVDEKGKFIKFFPSSIKPMSEEITSLL